LVGSKGWAVPELSCCAQGNLSFDEDEEANEDDEDAEDDDDYSDNSMTLEVAVMKENAEKALM
jgi:hypothetical protein